MRTWWIVKRGPGLEVEMWLPGWLRLFRLAPKCAIGPYFSYKEAMNVLHVWSK